MARVGRRAGESGRARDARARAAHHVGPAAGAVLDVARLHANGRTRVAGDCAGATGATRDGAGRLGRAFAARAGGVADPGGAAGRPRGHVHARVRALRRPGRARKRPLVAGVGGGAPGARLARRALSGLADHAGAAGRSVRLVVRLGAHGGARRTGDGAAAAGLAVHGAGRAGRTRRAVAVGADHVLATNGAVRLGLVGGGAHGAVRPAGRDADATRVGRRARRTGVTGRHIGTAVVLVPPCPGATAGPAVRPRGAAAVRQIGRGAQASATKARADQKQEQELCTVPHHPLQRFKSEDCKQHYARRDWGRRPAPAWTPPAPPKRRDSRARTTRTLPPPGPPRQRSRRPTA